MVTAGTYPMQKRLKATKIFKLSKVFKPSWFAFDKLQVLIIQFSLYYLSSGRLREVKNNLKTKFQTLSCKSGHDRLREVVTYKIFQR